MMPFRSDSSMRQVMHNGFHSGIQFVAYAVSGILLTPFLLKEFGAQSYGLIALAGFLTQYAGMISGCVGSSISRFLNISLNKNDWQSANEIFSTAVVGNVIVVILQIPVFAIGIWQLHWLIDFPVALAWDFKLLVAGNVLVFFVSIITGVLGTPIEAANRLDLGMKVATLLQAVRLILVYGLVRWLGARLWIMGVIDLALAIVGAGCMYIFHRRLAGALVFRWKTIKMRWLRPVLEMAGFMLITSLAHNLFYRTDVWMLNRFVDPQMAGVYAALLVWPNFLSQIVSRLTTVVGATYFIDYARNDVSRVFRNTLASEKLISYVATMAAISVCFFGDRILSLWLGRETTPTEYRLLILFFITSSFSLCSDAIWRIFQVYNKPKVPGIVALFCGVLNITLSLTLVFLGAGLYGVVIGTMISSFFLKAAFQPWYAARLLQKNSMTLWWPMLLSLGMCLLAIMVRGAVVMMHINHWYVGLLYVPATAVLMLYALTSRTERTYLLNVGKKYVRAS